MIELSQAKNHDEEQVLRLLMAMQNGDLPTRVTQLCTEDFVWANSGLETINGLQQLQAQMAAGGFALAIPILRSMTHFSADLVHIASEPGVVLTERVDHNWDAQGRDLMTPHICGVAELRDGKICAFRDFYDVACYQQQATAPDPAFALEHFRRENA